MLLIPTELESDDTTPQMVIAPIGLRWHGAYLDGSNVCKPLNFEVVALVMNARGAVEAVVMTPAFTYTHNGVDYYQPGQTLTETQLCSCYKDTPFEVIGVSREHPPTEVYAVVGRRLRKAAAGL